MKKSNTGKPSEEKFLNFVLPYLHGSNKNYDYHRFSDTHSIQRKNKVTVGTLPPQPADFLIDFTKMSYYAEVKSTTAKDKISLNFRRAQIAKMSRLYKMGRTCYFIFIHFLPDDEWYFLNGNDIVKNKKRTFYKKELTNLEKLKGALQA